MTKTWPHRTRRRTKDKEYEVVINGTPHTLSDDEITYEALGSSRTRATTRRRSSRWPTAMRSRRTVAAAPSLPASPCG